MRDADARAKSHDFHVRVRSSVVPGFSERCANYTNGRFLSLSPSQFSALAFFIVRPRDMEGPGREFANQRGVLGHFSQPIYG